MKIKKKLNLTKINITQLGTIKGGYLENPFNEWNKKPSAQPAPGGGACYSDAPTSCMVCV